MVSFYPTNYLNLQQPISKRLIFIFPQVLRKFIQYFIPVLEVGSTVLLTRSPLPCGRPTRMCKARFQRSFGARITPKRFFEPNLNSVFYFILVPAEYVCCPLERFEVYAPRGAYFLYLVKNIFFITWGFTIFSPKRKYTER